MLQYEQAIVKIFVFINFFFVVTTKFGHNNAKENWENGKFKKCKIGSEKNPFLKPIMIHNHSLHHKTDIYVRWQEVGVEEI